MLCISVLCSYSRASWDAYISLSVHAGITQRVDMPTPTARLSAVMLVLHACMACAVLGAQVAEHKAAGARRMLRYVRPALCIS